MEEEKETKSVDTTLTDLNKGKKNHTAVIALVILVLVVAIGFRGYYYYRKMQVSNPVKATKTLINKFGKSSNEEMKKVQKYLKGDKPVFVSANGELMDIKFNLEGGIDLKNRVLTAFANASGLGSDELYVDATIKKDNALFKVSKDGNSYKAEQDFSEIFDFLDQYFEALNDNSSERFLGYLADSFEETFTKDDFTKRKEENLAVGDKEFNATVYETEIDDEKLVKLFGSFIDKLIKDDEFITTMIDASKAMGEEITKQDVIDGLKTTKESLEYVFKDVSFKYDIMVYKTNIIAAGIVNEDMGFSIAWEEYKDYNYIGIKAPDFGVNLIDKKDESVIEFGPLENFAKEKVSITYDKKSNEFSVSYSKMKFATGTFEVLEHKNDIQISLSFDVALLKLSGKINSKVELLNSLKERTYNKPLDVTKMENAEKLMEEIENNEFIESLMDSAGGMFGGGSAWTSVDGLDF